MKGTFSDDQWMENFRMTKATFEILCDNLRPSFPDQGATSTGSQSCHCCVLDGLFSGIPYYCQSVWCWTRLDPYGSHFNWITELPLLCTGWPLQRNTVLLPICLVLDQARSVREPLQLDHRVAIAVYWMASSAEYRNIANLFGVVK